MRRAQRSQGPQGRTPERSGGVDGASTSRKIEGASPRGRSPPPQAARNSRRRLTWRSLRSRAARSPDRLSQGGETALPRRRLDRRMDGAPLAAGQRPPAEPSPTVRPARLEMVAGRRCLRAVLPRPPPPHPSQPLRPFSTATAGCSFASFVSPQATLSTVRTRPRSFGPGARVRWSRAVREGCRGSGGPAPRGRSLEVPDFALGLKTAPLHGHPRGAVWKHPEKGGKLRFSTTNAAPNCASRPHRLAKETLRPSPCAA